MQCGLTESSSRENVRPAYPVALQQACPFVAGHEIIGIRRYRKIEKVRVMRIGRFIMCRKALKNRRAAKQVHERTERVSRNQQPQLKITARPPQFVHLLRTSKEFESLLPPSHVDLVRWTVR